MELRYLFHNTFHSGNTHQDGLLESELFLPSLETHAVIAFEVTGFCSAVVNVTTPSECNSECITSMRCVLSVATDIAVININCLLQ